MDNRDFVLKCLELCGKPYSEVDCIGVISKALGIKMSGTNWLFRSINNSSKYRYLTRREVIGEYTNFIPGQIVFKVKHDTIPNGYNDKPDCYHCGVIDFSGNIIHSSPKTGVRKDIASNPYYWDYVGEMKQVNYTDSGLNDNGNESTEACYETLKELELALKHINNAISTLGGD